MLEKLIELASLEWSAASKIAFAFSAVCAISLVCVLISAVVLAIKVLISDIESKIHFR